MVDASRNNGHIAQLGAPFGYALRTGGLIHLQRVIDGGEKWMARMAFAPLRNRNQRIAARPIHCRHRHIVGQGAIAHAAQCVNIRPRPLIAPAFILLDGRVSWRHDGRHRTALGPYRLTRRAEVYQHGRVIRVANDDVARLDVSMQKIRAMHCLQAVENRMQNRLEFILGQDALAVEIRGQGLAFGVFHHDIRGVVRFKKAIHFDEVAMVKSG